MIVRLHHHIGRAAANVTQHPLFAPAQHCLHTGILVQEFSEGGLLHKCVIGGVIALLGIDALAHLDHKPLHVSPPDDWDD